ncbi:uncharacterized protein [Primulina huaijiensis]|uniref:uncharacterized protein n=1 Tax=Primulina huaijiensis TaxID=1492673 RepID=UPI003CC75D05
MKERGIRRRDESEPVFEAGRRNKKSRTLTSRGANEPPHLKFPDSMQSLPQAKLTLHDAAKNFHLSSPDHSSCITRVLTHVEETCLIDFPSKKEVVDDDASMNFVIGFVDEEEMFNMPALVNSMAEGMLLTPPAMKRGFRWSHDTDDQVVITGEGTDEPQRKQVHMKTFKSTPAGGLTNIFKLNKAIVQ